MRRAHRLVATTLFLVTGIALPRRRWIATERASDLRARGGSIALVERVLVGRRREVGTAGIGIRTRGIDVARTRIVADAVVLLTRGRDLTSVLTHHRSERRVVAAQVQAYRLPSGELRAACIAGEALARIRSSVASRSAMVGGACE